MSRQTKLSNFFAGTGRGVSDEGASGSGVSAKEKAEALARHRNYEKNRGPRSFDKDWEKQFSWLYYDEKRHLVFCKLCQKHKPHLSSQRNGFVKGSISIRSNNFKRHEENLDHKDAVRIEEARQKHKAQPGSLPADRLLHKMDEKAMKQRMMQFRTAHAIAKKGRPFSDFVWQCNLDEAKGLDVGNLYRNEKQAQTFIHHIARRRGSKI